MTDEAKPALPHHCPRCPSRWGGLLTAHCAACHLTFTGITAFDKHREGSHITGRYCITPEAAGLVLSSRAYPCYGMPGPETEFWNNDEGNDLD